MSEMGTDCTKCRENVYFHSRKEAAKRDGRLSSREGAAELLGVSPSTLADYELGNTKFIPADKVALMADLYVLPELKTLYCKNECPIGKGMPLATRTGSLESIVIRFLKEFDAAKLDDIRRGLIDIASDGRVDAGEKPEFQALLHMMDGLSLILSEIQLAGEKTLKAINEQICENAQNQAIREHVIQGDMSVTALIDKCYTL